MACRATCSVASPAAARALDSSLWELTALATHYYAPVAYLARVFLRGPLARQDYDIAGGYAANVYAALVKAELGRTARRAGAVALAAVPFAFEAPPPELAAAARRARGALDAGAPGDTVDDAIEWE